MTSTDRRPFNMKRLLILVLPLMLVAGILAAAYPNFTQSGNEPDPERETLLYRALLAGLAELHYDPLEIDDEFSKRCFKMYMDDMDNTKRFYTQQQYNRYQAYATDLDDLSLEANLEFFEVTYKDFLEQLDVVEGFYKDILAEPFNFDKDEFIEFEGEKINYAKDNLELRDYWRKTLKYRTLLRLNNLIDQENEKEKAERRSYVELEEEAREKVEDGQRKYFDRLKKNTRNDYLNVYFGAVTQAFDPHTSYFPPREKENFDIRMSGRLEGIGASLQEDDGYTKVVRIVPGSASWKQGDLEVDDLIIKVAQEDGEAMDIVNMRLSDVVQLIRGKKGTTVLLTVKKVDGTIKQIPIVRDVVNLEEGYLKSAVIQQETGQATGYIQLPSFYADFSGKGGRNCHEDMKEALIDLQKKNVEGIVLDLRNNGGGSLRDVIDIAGLFIPQGPVVQVKPGKGKPSVYRDRDGEVLYDGPLVILTNSFSASASEILAAAMQDYDRAIVIGSPSTYGKGTVQRFFELDNALPRGTKLSKPLGSLKVTIQKFYRIDGSTNQKTGVIPDIIIPDAYSYIPTGESSYDYALPFDKIKETDYKEYFSPNSYSSTITNSKQRVQTDTRYKALETNARQREELSKMTQYTLNLTKHRERNEQLEAAAKEFEELDKEIEGITISETKKVTDEKLDDKTVQDRRKSFHDAIRKDLYIYEGLQVIADMMQ